MFAVELNCCRAHIDLTARPKHVFAAGVLKGGCAVYDLTEDELEPGPTLQLMFDMGAEAGASESQSADTEQDLSPSGMSASTRGDTQLEDSPSDDDATEPDEALTQFLRLRAAQLPDSAQCPDLSDTETQPGEPALAVDIDAHISEVVQPLGVDSHVSDSVPDEGTQRIDDSLLDILLDGFGLPAAPQQPEHLGPGQPCMLCIPSENYICWRHTPDRARLSVDAVTTSGDLSESQQLMALLEGDYIPHMRY